MRGQIAKGDIATVNGDEMLRLDSKGVKSMEMVRCGDYTFRSLDPTATRGPVPVQFAVLRSNPRRTSGEPPGRG